MGHAGPRQLQHLDAIKASPCACPTRGRLDAGNNNAHPRRERTDEILALRGFVFRGPAALADVVREPLRVAGILGQEVQALALHPATAPARDTAHLDLQVDPQGAGRKIADPANAVIVEAGLRPPTGSADRFFERRTSVTTRARGSPKMPTTLGSGRKPGKRYESERRRSLRFRIAGACPVSAPAKMPFSAL